MHAIKGAWAGRTYALANSNDSGGRKQRTRRSKEERKELVVSFIKRHQKLNNGSFPSLNLTHKEVGGSFYTVREILREVIQENRVLAPPKLLPGEQNMESFLEQYPLGSISVDPQIDAASSVESQVPVNHHQYASKEWVLDSRPVIELDQGTIDNGTIVTASAYEIAESKESEGPIYVDLPLEQAAEADEDEVKELDVGEETSSPEEHNGKNFMEQGQTGFSSIDHQSDAELFDESESGVSFSKSTNEEQALDATLVSQSDHRSYVNGATVNGSVNAGEASLSPEEHDVENFMEQGSKTITSIDLQVDVKLVDESDTGVSYDKAANEGQVLDATNIPISDQGSLVNGTVVNESFKEVSEGEEPEEVINGKLLLERGVDEDNVDEKELEVYQAISPIAESPEVETFPIRPVPRMDYDSDEESNKLKVSVGALKKQDIEGLQVEAVNSSVPDRLHILENSIQMVEEKAKAELTGLISESNGVLLDDKAALTKESTARDVSGSTDLDAKDTLPTENKPKIAAASNKKQFGNVDVGSSKTQRSDPTLDRPKLESWEATTKKFDARKENENPLMAFVKAFVTAFVKFWSE